MLHCFINKLGIVEKEKLIEKLRLFMQFLFTSLGKHSQLVSFTTIELRYRSFSEMALAKIEFFT